MNASQAREFAHWLLDAVRSLEYGEVSLKLVVHHRQVRRIVRSTTVSELPITGTEVGSDEPTIDPKVMRDSRSASCAETKGIL